MYQARILDKDRQLKAVLPGVRWHYTRRINQASEINIGIPREAIDEVVAPDHPLYGFFGAAQPVVVEGAPKRERDNKPAYAAIASYVQIYQGDKLRASGKIVGRDLGQVVTVHAMTEEILLEANLTPAQYGKVWEGWDLADVARDLLDGWQTLRVKAKEQWQQYMVNSYHVDLTTDPGLVMLAKDAEGKYYQSGYITLMFSAEEIPNFKRWDRIRWSADSDGSGGPGQEPIVRTTIQWSPNGSSWSAEWDGGLPEEVGYYIGGTYSRVYVRINLYTNDTESEDAGGNPVGVTPTVFACELIARTEGPGVVVGNIPAMAGVKVKGLDADHTSALQVLVAACEQVDWEFAVWNGALSVAEALGTDRTRDFIFRGGSNIEVVALGDDDDELVNVLTAYSPGQGINRMEITLRDEASINEYGEYPAAVEFDVGTLAELEQKAQEFLSEHNSPKTQFEIAVAFEHGKEPEYGLGDKVRVADPDTGIVTTARIMTEAREYTESGLSVRLELGKASLNLQRVLEGKPQKPADPMAPTGIWARGIVRGIRVGFSKPKGAWDSTEVHVSTASGFTPSGGTLRDVGKQTQFDILELEPGTRYYAKVVHIDSDGRKSKPSKEVSAVPITMQEEQQKDYTDGVDDYVQGLSPVLLVSELPELPDPRYPVGTIVFLITEEKLYRNDGEEWVPLISMNLEDLEGKLQSNQIALEAIKEELIAAEAIASRHIQIEAVTTEKIAHEAVQTEHIDTGAITETKISDNAISAPKIKAGAIEADKIAANAVTAAKIAANAVTANKIAAGAVETEKLAANAVTAEKIAAGAIQTNHISAGAVKADQIDANAVTASKILAGAVTAVKIAADAVTTNKINAGAVTAEKIAAGAIQTWHLEAGAVTADKLFVDQAIINKIIAGIAQIGGLAADHIKAGAIQTQHLEAGAVTAEKLDANAVTADMVVAGIIQAGGIKADWYADIRNVLPYVGADSLDQNHPIEVDFYIPSETTNIVRIMLSAKGLRYRAYARTAAAGGSHTHSVTIPGHTHTLTVSTRTYNREVTKSGGAHTHGIGGVTDSTQTVASLTLSQGGAHSHSLGADGLGLPTSSNEHSHTASSSSAGGHTHTLAISEYRHTHRVRGDVSSVSNHTHGISVTTGSHSHSHSGSISSSGSHAHILEIESDTHYHTVSGTTTSADTHNHRGSTRTTGYIDVGNHTHDFTTDSASHSHTVSGNTAASGGHTHSVDLTTAQDAHSHTGSSIGAVSDHAHTITVGSYTHSHNVTGTTTTSGTHGGHVSDVSYAGHTHGIPISEPHTHEFVYVDTEVGSVTGTTSITVDTTSVSETHTHDLIYNIALDTTPANVRLYCDNGSGYDAGQNLAPAPGDDTQEYVLATELDLTNRFSGTGWKRIKFTSSRRGRIVWQLIIKLDLTA